MAKVVCATRVGNMKDPNPETRGTALRSVQCKVGRYREIPTNSRGGGSDQRL